MFIFYDINENFGRALEDDGDDEVWKMIKQENFILLVSSNLININ